MAWYLNNYRCYKCHRYWATDWSCACDDECPYCQARNATAIDSVDLTNIVVQENDAFIVLNSPPTAEHHPDYREVARFSSAKLAEDFIETLDREF